METDRIDIKTPEGLTLGLTLAGLGSRAAASIVDGLIIAAIAAGIYFSTWNTERSFAIRILLIVLPLILLFGYHLFFETWGKRQSPGKRALRLRVIRRDGGQMSFASALARNFLRIVDFLPLFYLIGMVTVFLTTRNQRLGDLAALTIVVMEPAKKKGDALQTSPPRGDLPEGWDVSAVTTEQMVLIRRFLERRSDLKSEARSRLATGLGHKIKPIVSVPPYTHGRVLSTEEFLETVALLKTNE